MDLLDVTHEFDSIYNAQSKILILGSIPSPKSREAGFYYAHKQNRFWLVLNNIFNVNLKTKEDKIKFLLENNIALWDVCASCKIRGASDNTITDVKVNDINKLVNNSNIKYIFTTGVKAYNLYMKYCYETTKIKAYPLPSTSSANIANYNLEQLIEKYKIIKEYLNIHSIINPNKNN